MGLGHSPSIVTSGLALYMDAGNVKSYPGSGTSWFDLSGNGNTGTFSASPPTYNAANGGIINFSGTAQYVTVPHSSSIALVADMTVLAWAKFTDFTPYNAIVGKTTAPYPNPYDMYLSNGGSTAVVNFMRGDGAAHYSTFASTTQISSGTWVHIGVTMSGTSVSHYLNAAAAGTGTLSTTIADAGGALRIGSRADGGTMMKGSMAAVMLYNRALTAAEIAQNFNALRGRFGV